MFHKQAPHETLISEKNERVLGTLTHRSWRKMAVLQARARFFDLDVRPEDLQYPTDALIHEARQTSGSVGGEHRKDLVETLKQAPTTTTGISLGLNPNPAPPEKKGF